MRSLLGGKYPLGRVFEVVQDCWSASLGFVCPKCGVMGGFVPACRFCFYRALGSGLHGPASDRSHGERLALLLSHAWLALMLSL